MQTIKRLAATLGLAGILLAGDAIGQVPVESRRIVPPANQVYILPQRRPIFIGNPAHVQITQVEAEVKIRDQVATTVLTIHLQNPSAQRQEAEVISPVPAGAVIRSFTFQGAGKEPTARLLPKDEAKRIYESIVNQSKDPALLEFVGMNLVQSSVFPVEPRGTQKVELTYEQVLAADGNRIDYVLPRSEAVDSAVPWKITMNIRSQKPISTAYSASHAVMTQRVTAGELNITLSPTANTEPGAFRVSYLMEQAGVSATFFAYPDPKGGGGYFLMLGGLPVDARKGKATAMKREVTLVIDRSGSMHGEKLEQVREAAQQVLSGLEDGEAFNVIIYSDIVEALSNGPIIKNKQTHESARQYIQALRTRGGTNIHDALLESLRPKPTEGMLPLVLFLTDGLPTVGQTSEVAIRDLVMKKNPFERRVFTFGVGVDVNTPLLERMASESRGAPEFILPKENVEVKVGRVFRRLSGPVMASPELNLGGMNAGPAKRSIDVLPEVLPDLFEGDQMVVLGRYIGNEPINVSLKGNFLGKAETFNFEFKPEGASIQNSFVPRLWAARRIAMLIDQVRQRGAEVGQTPVTGGQPRDPRIRELTDEIVRLSIEFGILTEYTAFLAEEGTPLTALRDRNTVRYHAEAELYRRGVQERSGLGSVNQSVNNDGLKKQDSAGAINKYFDKDMNQVQIKSVQQIRDKAYFRKGDQWVESTVINQPAAAPQMTVTLGSREHYDLAEKLARIGRAGAISVKGDMLLMVEGKLILIKN